MVVNFRARGISRGTRKLVRTSTLIKKKENLQPATTRRYHQSGKKQKLSTASKDGELKLTSNN
jgi:hypothetical protein